MRNIKIYRGEKIDEDKIAKLRDIAHQRYTKPIYDSSYWSIDYIEQLAFLHGINVKDEQLVLGSDWFLCFCILDNTFTFLEWVALDNPSTKFIQTIEMMNTLNKLLFKYKDKQFNAGMRHDTSYKLYSQMLKKGFFQESSHTLEVDFCNGFAPEQIRNIYYNYPKVEDYLASEEAKLNPENLTFILHCLTFSVTDKFVDKQSKLIRKL